MTRRAVDAPHITVDIYWLTSLTVKGFSFIKQYWITFRLIVSTRLLQTHMCTHMRRGRLFSIFKNARAYFSATLILLCTCGLYPYLGQILSLCPLHHKELHTVPSCTRQMVNSATTNLLKNVKSRYLQLQFDLFLFSLILVLLFVSADGISPFWSTIETDGTPYFIRWQVGLLTSEENSLNTSINLISSCVLSW